MDFLTLNNYSFHFKTIPNDEMSRLEQDDLSESNLAEVLAKIDLISAYQDKVRKALNDKYRVCC